MQRSRWIDAARGLAIVLVVVGHVVQYGAHGKFDFFQYPVWVWIYSFHMPLFVFVSGFLAHSAFERSAPLQVARRRGRSLLLPYVAWTVVGVTCISVLELSAGQSLTPYAVVWRVVRAFAYPDYSLWFLWVLFVGYLVMAGAHLVTRSARVPALVVLAGLIFAIPLDKGLSFYQLKWLFPFFVGGYLVRRWRVHLVRFERGVTWGATTLFLVSLMFWEREDSIYVSRMNLIDGSLTATSFSWAYRYVVAFAGTVAVVGTVRWLASRWAMLRLARLGQESIGIYAFQTYIVLLLPLIPSPAGSQLAYLGLYVPAVAAIVVTVAYFLTVSIRARKGALPRVFLGV